MKHFFFSLCATGALIFSGASCAAAPTAVPKVAPSTASSTPALVPMIEPRILPFDAPPLATLRRSPKKVFAHYFTPFPPSLDNADPKKDYYALGYLSPDGENGKHKGYGGFIRQRPLARATREGADWLQKDLEDDVRRAVALGIDGFIVDVLSYSKNDPADYNWNRTKWMMEAAQRVDPNFKIVVMPDMTSTFRDESPEKMTAAVRELNAYPAAYRLADGRLVVVPFFPESKTPAWWKTWLDAMKAEGIDIAFVPVVQGWEKHVQAFAPLSYGFSDWGWRSPEGNKVWRDVPTRARKSVPIWMMPVAPQDMRPKDLIYTEAANSANYRVMWENAIQGGADWVQIITWNDYSEHTEIAPSSGTQFGFYDLTAFYTAWFKTGKQPEIKRDVLYYFHRSHPMTAIPDASKQTRLFAVAPGSDAVRDEIELLAFLVLPGTLEIEIGGKIQSMQAPAGVTSFRVPVQNGRPVFRLLRDQKPLITLSSHFEISDKITFQDPLYRGGSSSRAPTEMP